MFEVFLYHVHRSLGRRLRVKHKPSQKKLDAAKIMPKLLAKATKAQDAVPLQQ